MKKIDLDHNKDPKALLEYLNNVQDIYKNINEFDPGKITKISIVFNDMIADMIINKNLIP